VQSGKIEQKAKCGTYCKIILVTGLFSVGKEIVVVGHYDIKHLVYSQQSTNTIFKFNP